MSRTRALFRVLVLVTLLASVLAAVPVNAQPPAPEDTPPAARTGDVVVKPLSKGFKIIDQPNAKEVMRLRQRQAALAAGDQATAQSLALADDRVLVILVEFAGTDTFTWKPGDRWDPLGRADPNEEVLDASGHTVIGDCSRIITEERTFTYTGPLHNQIPRPLSAADRSGDTIWTEDFSPEWFHAFMFGDGVVFHYNRVDGSLVHEDFRGKSVRHYFQDMSGNTYDIEGDVFGWLQLPHSTWWYGADVCPGARSYTVDRPAHAGAIPGAGDSRTLVIDALNALNAIAPNIPGFDWRNYDRNGDGIIDRLWIVHAGYGEEDSTTLLNRTEYGEASLWSHSSAITPAYEIVPGIKAGPYIMMPENGGIGVFAHEYAHNLGAMDLYAYDFGETSAGFWALQADDWTGYPIGFLPPAVDPLHLDYWGWLNPLIIDNPNRVYTFNLGQTSGFTPGENTYRGAKIVLPNGKAPLPVQPLGEYQWWGGKQDLANAMMTTKDPIAIPAGGATLSFDIAYGIETEWDFLWVQASADGGATWTTLTNAHTTCTHDPNWIGGEYGFPDDLCGAGIGGFTDYNENFPDFDTETFDLSAFAGQDILLRWWYMTDWATTYEGPFMDNVLVKAGETVVFSATADEGDAKWVYEEPWNRNDGYQSFRHNFYLQWRNVSATGGYDAALADPRWRFGPANTGLLVWYDNQFYSDNEVFHYLTDFPGWGPKGRALVIDSHPAPYRDPALVAQGYSNEGGNVTSRSLMRDAPFSQWPTVPFTMKPPYVRAETNFPGRLAVPDFHDSMGYYPGSEYVNRGPGYSPPSFRWVTRQWDSSTVVPAKAFYGIRAPGYRSNDEFRFACSPYPGGRLACYWYGPGTGLGYNGGTGNPGDLLVQYGWHVQILSQTAAGATVKVWNSKYEMNAAFVADRPSVRTNQNVRYRFNLNQNLGGALALFACSPIDPTQVEYVPGTATDGAMALTSSCPAAAAALEAGQSLESLAGGPEAPILSIGWFKPLLVRQAASFDFTVKVKATGGTLNQTLRVFEIGGTWRKSFNAPPVRVNPLY